MFTGIVEEMGQVKRLRPHGDGIQLEVEAKKVLSRMGVDNSIAVNGTCLTVVGRKGRTFAVEAVKETLKKTNLGRLVVGSRVNLERPVSLAQRLGGHIVQGHVDTTGRVLSVRTLKASWMFTIAFPSKFRKYLIPVGSVAVDGVSLTVARLGTNKFEVAIIPYTYEQTLFGQYRPGSKVNLEFDMVGKYIESLMRNG
ncbi:MAG TPA: riboflavin synthase [Bacteroidota bacterium]|nr:riboflavin synthase [Bacteroidota bacterium]